MHATADRNQVEDAARKDVAREDGGRQDAALVMAALVGDQAAFDRLVERYQRRAVAVAYRLLSDIHDAADTAQDAFLRAFLKLESLDDPARFGPWLMRIVTNLALNRRRARARTAALSIEDVGEGQEQPGVGSALSARSDDAEAQVRTGELQEAIARAIEMLPEKQRTAFVLFAVEGIPQKQVAATMECSVDLVKWNVFQARKALRVRLAEYID